MMSPTNTHAGQGALAQQSDYLQATTAKQHESLLQCCSISTWKAAAGYCQGSQKASQRPPVTHCASKDRLRGAGYLQITGRHLGKGLIWQTQLTKAGQLSIACFEVFQDDTMLFYGDLLIARDDEAGPLTLRVGS